jgi:hypothetical protein
MANNSDESCNKAVPKRSPGVKAPRKSRSHEQPNPNRYGKQPRQHNRARLLALLPQELEHNHPQRHRGFDDRGDSRWHSELYALRHKPDATQKHKQRRDRRPLGIGCRHPNHPTARPNPSHPPAP